METTMIEEKRTRSQKWGWGILIAMCSLLVLNGLALFFISAMPTTFEQDTGVPMDEVSALFPTVADQVVSLGQASAILLGGLALMGLVVSLQGYRRHTFQSWIVMWVFIGTLVALTLWSILVSDRPDIILFYVGLTLATLLGQLLAGRGLEAPV